jgi:dTDP-4-amino-4,6-dideoxygalactose transaminase
VGSGSCAKANCSIFSLHPVKHIAAGEGGVITTNSEKLYKKLTELRSHGITKSPDKLIENHGGWYYEMQELGYNYRLTEIQSALALSQLQRINSNLKRRNEIAEIYDSELSGLPIVLPQRDENIYHAFHLYVILSEERKELYEFLRSKAIFTQVHYIPVHFMPYYRNLGWKKGDFPIGEWYYQRCLSLPVYPSLTEEEQGYVIDKIKQFLN